MKDDREDIDWGTLRLIVASFKREFGLTENGRLGWTKDIAESFVAEMRSKISPGKSTKEATTAAIKGPSEAVKMKLPGWMTGGTGTVKKKKIF